MKKWIADVVGTMHINHIKQTDIARKTGYSATYVNYLLNGKRDSEYARAAIKKAIKDISRERKEERKKETTGDVK